MKDTTRKQGYKDASGKQKKETTDSIEIELKRRPQLSIRTRLGVSFSLIFAVCAIIIIWIVLTLSKLEHRLHFLELADDYLSEIQQARRFEKNYLLYGTDLEDAIEHLKIAHQVLYENRLKILRVLQEQNFQIMVQHLRDYEIGLKELGKVSDIEKREEIEAKVRNHGSDMLSFAMELVRKERQAAENTFQRIRKTPLFLLVGLMALVFLVVTLLTRQILNTLSRFMSYTERIAQGNFRHITPAKKYRDEFTYLALAFNHMIDELNRRSEEIIQSKKLSSLGTLTSGVAHELNNPLNNISITAESLLDGYPNLPEPEAHEMIQDILNQADRASQVVKNLLEFSRTERPFLMHLNMKEVIEGTVRLVKNQLMVTGIELEKQIEDDLPPIRGRRQDLQQALLNILLNSIQAMPNGGMISIRAHQIQNGYIRVELGDTGGGIKPVDLEHIFDPFYTTKPVGEGTGLGLSLTYSIIRTHGGYIEVKSEVDKGTVFSIYLPLADGKKEAVTESA